MSHEYVLRGGTVVTPHFTAKAHVWIQGGRIAGLIADGAALPSAPVIDVDGLHILPGLIDAHVHFRDPGLVAKEDWATGSAAAVRGGVTTVVEMPNTLPSTKDAASVTMKVKAANGRSYTNFGLFGVLVEGSGNLVHEMVQAGVLGFKVFLGETTGNLPAPSNGELVHLLHETARFGVRVGFHAEDRSICDWFTASEKAAGRDGLTAHSAARPPIAGAVATAQILAIAEHTGAPVHIVHVDNGAVLEVVRRSRRFGIDVTCETCPHYLLLDAADPAVQAMGAVAKVNPPLRDATNAGLLWQGIRDKTIDMIATDHAPHLVADKSKPTLWEAAAGAPGVETVLPLLLTAAHEGRLSLPDIVRLTCEGPARTWGIYPGKGSFETGSDADFTLVDLQAPGEIHGADLVSKGNLTPFEGWKTRGRVVSTIIGGHTIVKDGHICSEPLGRFISPNAHT